ncbi:MAG: DUF2934 domain-containing protein [Bryobacteraceae bacterium]|jgi:hypothetical protein
MEHDQKLWQDYRNAWETYSRKHAALQCLMDSVQPEKSRIDSVVLELEKARSAHGAARDRLAKHLSARLPFQSAVPAESEERRVRSTAQLLWEMSGRPDGTAELDWLRAEHLIRAASQTN